MDDQLKNKLSEIGLRMSYRFEDIKKSYNKNFQLWLYAQSHKKEILSNDQYGRERLIFDENGFITNATFSKKTNSGFNLLEQDFLKKELKRINKVNPDSLDLDGQKYIAFLKDYFENKEPDNKQKKIKEKYFAKHYIVTYILDCFSSNKPFYTTNQTELEGKIDSKVIQPKYQSTGRHFVKTLREDYSHYDKDKFTEDVIIDKIGENWRDIVLELSDDPRTLKAYLELNYKKG